MPSGFKIADAYVEVRLDKDQLRSDLAGLPGELGGDVDRAGNELGGRLGRGIGDGANGADEGRRIIEDVDSTLGPGATQSGEDAGNRLSQGMAQATSNNSPLIAAAIGGALMAGAPVVVAGATSLFIAIAAAAEHSNQQMQLAFNQTKNVITSTFTDAAQVTVPFFVNAMGRIGSAVQGLAPQLHTLFASLGAPIDSLTTGLINLANNAMPGLVRMVGTAGPVFQGLANLLGDVGTGLGQMFSIISQHAQAGGTVFTALGSALSALLSILGQLVGVGAEVASQILPPIASALHVVASALGAVAPALGPVLTGFLGFKAITLLAGPIGLLATKIAGLGAAGAAASAGLMRFSGALPAIAVGVAAVTAAWSASNTQLSDWAKGLEQGGHAAETATKQLHDAHTRSILDAHSLSDAWGIVKGAFSDGAAQIEGYSSAQDKATQEAQRYYNSLSPLGKAQADQTKAQNDLNLMIQRYGPASGQAAGAAVAYQDASAKVQAQEDKTSIAIHGVTQAMIDQANEALAAANSGFAYQQDVLNTKDAEDALKKSIQQHGTASEDTQKATIAFGQALLSQASAAGQAAADASGLTDKMDLQKVSQQATLAELLKLKQQYGSEFPASLQATIDKLQAAGVKLDTVGAKKPTPTVNLNDGPFNSIYAYVNGAINTLHGKKPTPTAFLNSQPFGGAAASMNAMLSYLASRHITPSASLIAYTLAAERALNYAARDRRSYVTQYVSTFRIGAAATGGKVGDVVGPRYDVGGKVRGPGGPTDDMIQAITGGGSPLRVSNDEWVIRGSSSAKYGDAKMAAVNDGRAVITVPGPQPASSYATGGSLGNANSSGVSIAQLHVHVNGVVDFTIPGAADRVARPIQQAILRLERSAR